MGRSDGNIGDGSHRTLFVILAFVFGVVFLGALFGVAVLVPNPTDSQREIFRMIIAAAAAGAIAVVPGFLEVKMGAGKQLTLRAGGALAVFVVVYFFDPAARASEF